MNLKLTKDHLKSICDRQPIKCTKEEIYAFLKLFGLQVKEFRETRNEDAVSDQLVFEVHHKLQYIIEVEASAAYVVSYNNEWVDFGDNVHGISMSTKTMGELVVILLNFFVEKLRIRFDGPSYDEDRDEEYSGVNEMQELLECAQELLTDDKS